MRRITVEIKDEMMAAQLRSMAEARGLSLAALIREALTEKVARSRPKPRSLGMGASGHSNTAREAGEVRFEAGPYRSE